jgi:AcrR family transcriptional regulator
LLVAGAEVFAELGYHAASVEEIARRAGYTRGAVYSNFPGGKPDLFLALADARNAELTRGLTAALGAGDPERFAATYAHVVRPADPDPLQRASDEFLSAAADDPELRQRAARLIMTTLDRVTALMSEQLAAEGTEPPVPVSELALLAVALSAGLRSIEAISPDLVPRDFELRVIGLVAGDRHGAGTAD